MTGVETSEGVLDEGLSELGVAEDVVDAVDEGCRKIQLVEITPYHRAEGEDTSTMGGSHREQLEHPGLLLPVAGVEDVSDL